MQPTTGLTQLSMPIFADLPDSKLLMSSSADSHALTSLRREKVLDLKARILVYGGSSIDLLAKYDHALSCWKMLQQLLMTDGVELKLLRRLPDWGTAHNGALFRLLMLELLMNANDGFAWATPTADDYQNRQPPTEDKLHITASGTLKLDTGVKSHVRLSQSVKYYEQKQDWHTPIANDANKSAGIAQIPENGLSAQVQWAASTVNTSKNNGSASQFRRNSKPLDAQVKETPEQPGQMNPAWVEMLMGFPPGWTELD